MDELTAEDWRGLKAEARRVYERNEVDTDTAYFHMPSAEFYPSLFAWDSGFQAVVMIHLDLSDSASCSKNAVFAPKEWASCADQFRIVTFSRSSRGR